LKVLKYFGFVPDKDGNPIDSATPKCKSCFKSVSVKWANISNLLSDLKFSHVTEYKEIKQIESKATVLDHQHQDEKTRNHWKGASKPLQVMPMVTWF